MTARHTGPMTLLERFGSSDHACWAYRTDADRAAAATAWLADGLALGQRAMYVADAAEDVLTAELADLPGRDAAIADGALVVANVRRLYDLAAPIDAQRQLAAYSAVVDQALADGFAGVRVAVDVTALISDVDRRQAHLRWEHVADRYTSGHPLAPLCLYDRRAIADFPTLEHIL